MCCRRMSRAVSAAISTHRYDTGTTGNSIACLFNSTGTRLTTFTNPVPTHKRAFSYALTAA
jgi:hypothetical protein